VTKTLEGPHFYLLAYHSCGVDEVSYLVRKETHGVALHKNRILKGITTRYLVTSNITAEELFYASDEELEQMQLLSVLMR
jgi:hypothetical protein